MIVVGQKVKAMYYLSSSVLFEALLTALQTHLVPSSSLRKDETVNTTAHSYQTNSQVCTNQITFISVVDQVVPFRKLLTCKTCFVH